MHTMKQQRTATAVCCLLALLGGFASNAAALDAYFDSEISTSLEYKPSSGTLIVKMVDEDLPPILPDVAYKRTILVEILFDASKTMGETDINGIRKIDVAKKLAAILLNYFPSEDTQFALRVNGGKFANNCLDSALVVPFSEGNAQQITDALQKIEPVGLSPLTYSMREMLKDYKGHIGSRIAFAITDGQETCDDEPVDACTVTMDMLVDAEFGGNLNILGVNTIYDNANNLLSCLANRGNGVYLDSNRNNGRELGQVISDSSQLRYSITRIFDPKTLAEGKILGLLYRRVGDATEINKDNAQQDAKTDQIIQPGIIQKEQSTSTTVEEIRIDDLPRNKGGFSSHELPPGVYKIEFLTTPPLASYFTIDQGKNMMIGVIRSGKGFDLYDRAHLAMGNRYYDNGQYQEALTEYEKVLAFDERNVDAHLNMGIIYQDILNDKEKASLHYRTYLDLQGPRQEEVGKWFRQVQGLPSEEEELQRKLQEREEERAKEEAAKVAAEQEAERQKEHQKAVDAYNEILTANPNIRELSEDSVVSKAAKLEVIVSSATTDVRAEKLAIDVGDRMKRLLNHTPEVYIYRETDPNTLIKKAVYDQGQQAYIIATE